MRLAVPLWVLIFGMCTAPYHGIELPSGKLRGLVDDDVISE
jgi:hypothetical protein